MPAITRSKPRAQARKRQASQPPPNPRRSKKNTQQIPNGDDEASPSELPEIRTLSRLEKLPNELLERIYIFSLKLDHRSNFQHDLALVKASPHLACALATRRVRNQLMLKTLFYIPELGYDQYRTTIDHDYDWQHLPALLNEVLCMPWYTFAYWKACMTEYFTERAHQYFTRWAQEAKEPYTISRPALEASIGAIFATCTPTKASASTFSAIPLQSDHPFKFDVPFALRVAPVCGRLQATVASTTYEGDLHLSVELGDYFIASADDHLTRNVGAADVKGSLEGSHIPTRLLHGPWTADKLALLQLLIAKDLTVAPADRQVLDHGLLEAIISHDLNALAVLLPPMTADHHPPRTPAGLEAFAPPRRADGSRQVLGDGEVPYTHLGTAPRVHHLRAALRELENAEWEDDWPVCALVVERIVFVDPLKAERCPVFWGRRECEWVVERVRARGAGGEGEEGEEGEEVGSWLRKAMQRMDGQVTDAGWEVMCRAFGAMWGPRRQVWGDY
ncbi:hypothetical protein MMC30_000023 [Trapelia coarctata]|nr:hypothetical protein [Trapelia coarctata]